MYRPIFFYIDYFYTVAQTFHKVSSSCIQIRLLSFTPEHVYYAQNPVLLSFLTCKTAPSLSTTNTIRTQRVPIMTTTNFMILLAVLSLIFFLKQGRMKSSNRTAPIALRLLDIVLWENGTSSEPSFVSANVCGND